MAKKYDVDDLEDLDDIKVKHAKPAGQKMKRMSSGKQVQKKQASFNKKHGKLNQ